MIKTNFCNDFGKIQCNLAKTIKELTHSKSIALAKALMIAIERNIELAKLLDRAIAADVDQETAQKLACKKVRERCFD